MAAGGTGIGLGFGAGPKPKPLVLLCCKAGIKVTAPVFVWP